MQLIITLKNGFKPNKNVLCLANMKKYEAPHPKFREYTQLKISKNKFLKWLGYEITKIEPGYIEGQMKFKEELEQQNGWLHGGLTATLLDMAAGYAAYSMVQDGQQVFTVEAKVSYYNPGTAALFFTRGYVTKPGKRFHFCEAEVYYLKEDGGEITVAKGSSTMAVI